LDLGGGYRIPYEKHEKEVDLKNLFSKVAEIYRKYFPTMPHKIIIEPGRFLSA
jgi:diaminopimelate decarboxylase